MAPHLSVVIPFRNEAESLRALYRELAAVLDSLPFASEMIFVDDESRDGGREIVGDLSANDARLRLLMLSPHCGQSAALEAGFAAARGEIIGMLDADLQNDPADLPSLIDALEDADCVCGFRVDRQDSAAKRLASKLANAVRRGVLSDPVRDVGCSLRVMRSSHLKRIKLFRGGHRFLPALLEMEGARVVERPVRHRPRRYGTSNYAIGKRLSVVWIDLLAVAWLKRRIDRYEVKEFNRRASP